VNEQMVRTIRLGHRRKFFSDQSEQICFWITERLADYFCENNDTTASNVAPSYLGFVAIEDGWITALSTSYGKFVSDNNPSRNKNYPTTSYSALTSSQPSSAMTFRF
jgi:hypothetical protein